MDGGAQRFTLTCALWQQRLLDSIALMAQSLPVIKLQQHQGWHLQMTCTVVTSQTLLAHTGCTSPGLAYRHDASGLAAAPCQQLGPAREHPKTDSLAMAQVVDQKVVDQEVKHGPT